jgi:hypothetical protein
VEPITPSTQSILIFILEVFLIDSIYFMLIEENTNNYRPTIDTTNGLLFVG